jgi:alpha-ketoglutarate-dependent taurine dioxygenase
MGLDSLDALDELMARDTFQFTYKLLPGEMLILNNQRMLHGRKAFAAEPGQANRLLIRVYAARGGAA